MLVFHMHEYIWNNCVDIAAGMFGDEAITPCLPDGHSLHPYFPPSSEHTTDDAQHPQSLADRSAAAATAGDNRSKLSGESKGGEHRAGEEDAEEKIGATAAASAANKDRVAQRSKALREAEQRRVEEERAKADPAAKQEAYEFEVLCLQTHRELVAKALSVTTTDVEKFLTWTLPRQHLLGKFEQYLCKVKWLLFDAESFFVQRYHSAFVSSTLPVHLNRLPAVPSLRAVRAESDGLLRRHAQSIAAAFNIGRVTSAGDAEKDSSGGRSNSKELAGLFEASPSPLARFLGGFLRTHGDARLCPAALTAHTQVASLHPSQPSTHAPSLRTSPPLLTPAEASYKGSGNIAAAGSASMLGAAAEGEKPQARSEVGVGAGSVATDGTLAGERSAGHG
jgi:hypothetical protein